MAVCWRVALPAGLGVVFGAEVDHVGKRAAGAPLVWVEVERAAMGAAARSAVLLAVPSAVHMTRCKAGSVARVVMGDELAKPIHSAEQPQPIRPRVL